MKAKKSSIRATSDTAKEAAKPSSITDSRPDGPKAEAFLEEAKNEAKRKLLMDHIGTIKTLRNEKRFTFRAIAEWLTQRGIETDHSAVYRTYLAAIPGEERDPFTDWSDVDEPGYGDEDAK